VRSRYLYVNFSVNTISSKFGLHLTLIENIDFKDRKFYKFVQNLDFINLLIEIDRAQDAQL